MGHLKNAIITMENDPNGYYCFWFERDATKVFRSTYNIDVWGTILINGKYYYSPSIENKAIYVMQSKDSIPNFTLFWNTLKEIDNNKSLALLNIRKMNDIYGGISKVLCILILQENYVHIEKINPLDFKDYKLV
jgi:hypothetical protein